MFEDIERVCARCGVTFYLRCGARGWTYKLLIDGRQRYYCSHACMREAQRQLETVRREFVTLTVDDAEQYVELEIDSLALDDETQNLELHIDKQYLAQIAQELNEIVRLVCGTT